MIENLYLSQNNITPETAAEIIQIFKRESPRTRVLFLSKNPLEDEGASAIVFTILQKKVGIEALDLSNTKCSDGTAAAIGQVLRTSQSLEMLFLNDNIIQAEGAVSLFESLEQNSVGYR